jgi:hypothetical protein
MPYIYETSFNNIRIITQTFGYGKGKDHPRICHEDTEGEYRNSSTFSLTSALKLGWVVNASPRPLYPWERPGTHCIGGWVCPRFAQDGCGKSLLFRDSIPSPWRVAVPDTLSRSTFGYDIYRRILS